MSTEQGVAATGVLVAEVEAVDVRRISPSFVRVVLAGPGLADLGVVDPRLDQRIKLVFPAPGHPLPSAAESGASWLADWLARAARERGHMRTYTIRDLQGAGPGTRLVVDFVVHEDGLAGPGASWALAAVPGDRVLVVGPRRGVPYGGIEFAPPPDTRSLLLIGDESAVPAIASILEGLTAGPRGVVFVEVPTPADIADLQAPPGVELCWLARRAAEPGTRLVPAVRAHLGLGAGDWVDPAEVDPDLWETPTYSSSGAALDASARIASDETGDLRWDGLYAWIAGESRMVTTLRRALVTELGVDRSRVAFMGYWRRGVAMRS
jgi:NADPH-dependent ferric siderophore reductase